MLQRFLVLGMVVFVMSVTIGELAASNPSGSGWVNSLKPEGKPGPELTLATNGKTDYVILIPAKPTPQEKRAALELSTLLKKITGAEFPEVLEGAEKVPDSAKTISVGRTQLLENTALTEKATDLGDEGYAIAVKGENLFLFGGKIRGPVYAVFALLEEDLGVRWYMHEWYYPEVTRWNI